MTLTIRTDNASESFERQPSRGPSLWLAGAAATAAWAGLIIQFAIVLVAGRANGSAGAAIANFFSYFTVLTNLLVATALASLLLRPRSGPFQFFGHPGVLAASAMYIVVVGVVYKILLRSLWQPTGWQLIADRLLHTVVPLLYAVWWFIAAPKDRLSYASAVRWTVYPAVFFAYSMVRGPLVNWYPYPFLDVAEHGYLRVLLNAGILLSVFLGLGLLTVEIARRRIARA